MFRASAIAMIAAFLVAPVGARADSTGTAAQPTQTAARAEESRSTPVSAEDLGLTGHPSRAAIAQRMKTTGKILTGIGAAGVALLIVGLVGDGTHYGCSSGSHDQQGFNCSSQNVTAWSLTAAGAVLTLLAAPGITLWALGQRDLARAQAGGSFAMAPTVGPNGSRGASASYTLRF